MTTLLKRLWHHVEVSRRIQFGGLLLLMVLASFAEVLSLGSVLPFLGVLTSPEKVFDHPLAQPVILLLQIGSPQQLLLPLTLLFGVAAIVNGAMRLLLLWVTTRLSVVVGAELSLSMYRRTLYQPYSQHISRNSSEIVNAISTKTGVTIHVLLMIMNLLSSVFIMVAILSALLAVDTQIAVSAMLGFGIIYAGVIRITRKSLLENSERVARETSLVIKSLQEGLGGIRDVLLDGSQELYCEIYQRSDFRARTAQGNSSFLASSPRFAVEALALLFIAGLAYFMSSQPDGLARAIPILGVLALGAQRMLPVMQQGYAAWASIKSCQVSLSDALSLLDQPIHDWAISTQAASQLSFSESIKFSKVSFRYSPDSSAVLKSIDLCIPRGARIGFVGPTGSGKSTLLDIVLGLLPPSAGEFLVDGKAVLDCNRRAWQRHLAHVPQSVFLADLSIEENIAFGVPRNEIDQLRVRQAAKRAQIADTIESLPDQYLTMVGERGVRLSGGQRQRIGIARALYKNADVIVFDEATSALDGETEEAVIRAIDSLGPELTVLIIAHRITTLRQCDRIYRIDGGKVSWSGRYDQLMESQIVK